MVKVSASLTGSTALGVMVMLAVTKFLVAGPLSGAVPSVVVVTVAVSPKLSVKVTTSLASMTKVPGVAASMVTV